MEDESESSYQTNRRQPAQPTPTIFEDEEGLGDFLDNAGNKSPAQQSTRGSIKDDDPSHSTGDDDFSAIWGGSAAEESKSGRPSMSSANDSISTAGAAKHPGGNEMKPQNAQSVASAQAEPSRALPQTSVRQDDSSSDSDGSIQWDGAGYSGIIEYSMESSKKSLEGQSVEDSKKIRGEDSTVPSRKNQDEQSVKSSKKTNGVDATTSSKKNREVTSAQAEPSRASPQTSVRQDDSSSDSDGSIQWDGAGLSGIDEYSMESSKKSLERQSVADSKKSRGEDSAVPSRKNQDEQSLESSKKTNGVDATASSKKNREEQTFAGSKASSKKSMEEESLASSNDSEESFDFTSSKKNEKTKTVAAMDEGSDGSLDALNFGGNDDASIGEFSLGASKDLDESLSKYDLPEYRPKRGNSEDSLDVSKFQDMNQDMNQGFQGFDDSDLPAADVESALDKKKSKKGKKSKKVLYERPGFSTGLWRHFARGSAVLLLLSAIGLPIYFFVFFESDNAEEPLPPIGPLFPTEPTFAHEHFQPSRSPTNPISNSEPKPTASR
jgi:hypothetical protein